MSPTDPIATPLKEVEEPVVSPTELGQRGDEQPIASPTELGKPVTTPTEQAEGVKQPVETDRKSTRLNSSHVD